MLPLLWILAVLVVIVDIERFNPLVEGTPVVAATASNRDNSTLAVVDDDDAADDDIVDPPLFNRCMDEEVEVGLGAVRSLVAEWGGRRSRVRAIRVRQEAMSGDVVRDSPLLVLLLL